MPLPTIAPASTAGDAAQISDYRAQTLAGIAKLQSVNPEVGNMVLNAYESRSSTGQGFFSGLLSTLGKGLAIVAEPFVRLNSAIAEPFRNEETGQEDFFGVDIIQGLSGEKRTFFADVLESHGMPDSAGTKALGFVMDVALDPTTYLTFGAAGVARKVASKAAIDITGAGAKATIVGNAQGIFEHVASKGAIPLTQDQVGVIARHVAAESPTIGRTLTTKGVQAGKSRLPGFGKKTTVEFGGDFHRRMGEAFTQHWEKYLDEDAAAAIGGLAANSQTYALERQFMRFAERESESLGRQMAEWFRQYGSVRGVRDTWTSPQGVRWTAAEREAFLRSGADLTPEQIKNLANNHWLKNISEEATQWGQQGLLSRNAAAAMGGMRFKFGIPFGQSIARKTHIPWIGHRWQTAAIEYNGRMNFRVGRYFRGLSGLNRVDQAVNDTATNFNHADRVVWLEKGHTALRDHMIATNRGAEFSRIFGNNGVSSFITASERLGQLTEGITAGGRGWRRGGWYHPSAYDYTRAAKEQQLNFLRWATKPKKGGLPEKEWTKVGFQLESESPETLAKIMDYMEGLDEYGIVSRSDVPDYARGVVDELRIRHREWFDRTRKDGGWVGDQAEVQARIRAERLHKVATQELTRLERMASKLTAGNDTAKLKTIQTEIYALREIREKALTGKDPQFIRDIIERGGYEAAVKAFRELDDTARAVQLPAVSRSLNDVVKKESTRIRKELKAATEAGNAEDVEILTAALEANQALSKDLKNSLEVAQTSFLESSTAIQRMNDWDELRASYGMRRLEKYTPYRFMPRRMRVPIRDSLIGDLVRGENITFAAAKSRISRFERQMSELSAREAEDAMKKAFPQLDQYTGIWERNPITLSNIYMHELGDEVLQANLRRGARNLFKQVGGTDNGSMIYMFDQNMEAVLKNLERAESKALSGVKDAEAANKTFVNSMLRRLLGKSRLKRERAIQDLEEIAASNVPGRWKESPYLDKTELVPLTTLKRLREFDREGVARIKSPGAQKALEEDVAAKGFNEPLILIADDAGRIYLGEGNHRLIAAEKAGFDKVPVRVSVNKSRPATATKGSQGDLAGKEGVATRIMEYRGKDYVPADMKPSDVLPSELLADNLDILPDEIVYTLQSVAKQVNQVQARLGIGETPVKRAIVDARDMTHADKKLLAPLDVPGLENHWAHPLIAAEFHRAMKGPYKTTQPVHQFWRSWVMGPWKQWATIYWPGFHARNNMGAAFNNWLGGVQIPHYTTAFKMMKSMTDPELAETVWKYNVVIDGVKMEKLTYGDVMRMAEDEGIVGANLQGLADISDYQRSISYGRGFSVGTNRFSHALSEGATIRGKKLPAVRKMVTVGGKEFDVSPYGFMSGWRKAGIASTRTTESFHRLAGYLHGLEEASGDTAAARAFVMMRHGDYEELTDFEQNLKDVLPFYKWMRTNIPFQVKMMMENPGKQAAVFDLQNALVDPEDRSYLPQWMQDTKFLVPWGGGDLSGNEYMMLDLPLSDLKMGTNEFFASFVPILKPLFENFVIEKSIFTGAPIEGDKFVPLSQPLQFGIGDALEFFGVAKQNADGKTVVSDKMENVLNALPIFAKFRTFLTSDPDRIQQRVGAITSMITGVAPRDIGLEELNAAEAEFFFSEVKPLLDELRGLGHVFPDADDIANIPFDPSTRPNPAELLEQPSNIGG